MSTPRLRRPRVEHADRQDDDRATPVAPVSATERPEVPAAGRCNLPGCDETPEWRGLCSAHRQTHRGLASPKEVPSD